MKELSVYEAEVQLCAAALKLQSTQLYIELHPDDPHGADQADMDREQLADAVQMYVQAVAAAAA